MNYYGVQGSRNCGTFSDPELTQNHFLQMRMLRFSRHPHQIESMISSFSLHFPYPPHFLSLRISSRCDLQTSTGCAGLHFLHLLCIWLRWPPTFTHCTHCPACDFLFRSNLILIFTTRIWPLSDVLAPNICLPSESSLG